MGLVSLEFAVRASTWGYLFAYPNFVLTARTVLAERDGGRYVHDPELGPRAARRLCRGRHHHRGRRAAAAPASRSPGAPILAVGDSFTYGDEVNDGQTWPAQLQLLTGRRVLNAGVSGYGFDQIVLRAEQLAAKVQAVGRSSSSFIADDIRRTEMRRLWSADKPYFVIDDGKLVPARRAGAAARRSGQHAHASGSGRWATRTSFDFILRRLDLLHDWYGDHKRVQAPGTGEHLSCLLTAAAGRAAEAERRQGHRAGRVRSRGVGRPRLRRRAAAHDRGPARLRGQGRPRHASTASTPWPPPARRESSTSPGT